MPADNQAVKVHLQLTLKLVVDALKAWLVCLLLRAFQMTEL